MRPTLRFLAAGLAATLALAACGGDDDDDDAEATATTTTVEETTDDDATTTTEADESTTTVTAEPSGPATVGVGETTLGETLVDADGHTLYVFDNDPAGESTCVDACADAWPPLVVDGDPIVGDDVDATLVATITRADGSTQVTINEMPVYRFSGDTQPGDTTGLGIGEVWWPISPAGEKLTTAQQASTGGGLGY